MIGLLAPPIAPPIPGSLASRTPVPPRDAYEALLGADLIAGWHCADVGSSNLISGNVDALRDRYRGLLLSAPQASQRPVFGADGSNFHGRSVIGGTTNRCLAVTGLAANLVTGRPCIFIRYRTASNPVANTGAPLTLFGMGVNATSDTYRCGVLGNGTTCTGPNMHMGGGVICSGPVLADTLQHTVCYWLDGTNANVRVDSTLFTAASVVSVGNTTAVSIGKAASGNYHHSDSYFACVLVVRAYPGAAIETAIRTLLENEY